MTLSYQVFTILGSTGHYKKENNKYKPLRPKQRKATFHLSWQHYYLRIQWILFFCPVSYEISRCLIGRTDVCWEDRYLGKSNVLGISKLWKSICPLKLENIPFLESELVGVHLDSEVLEKLHYLGCNKNTAFSNCWNTICYQLLVTDLSPSIVLSPPTLLKHMKYWICILWTFCSP